MCNLISLTLSFLTFGTFPFSSFFFFNDTATTEIYTLSLHDALPIYEALGLHERSRGIRIVEVTSEVGLIRQAKRLEDELEVRSEEHTSELQSRLHLVCRLLLEKKKEPRTMALSAS